MVSVSDSRGKFHVKDRQMLKSEFDSYSNSSRYRIESADGSQIFHIALIDYLQEWNMKKKMERFAKCVMKGNDKDLLLSAIPANPYYLRFN